MIAFINAFYDGGSNGSSCSIGSNPARFRNALNGLNILNDWNRQIPWLDWKASEASKMICEDKRIVHTLGHSTRTIESFVDLLKAHRIEQLIDVRLWPTSKRHPHFNREALAASLQGDEIAYTWRQDLGGFRKAAADSPNSAWRVTTFRAYADYMLTPPFATIMEELETLATKQRLTLMCAEAVHWRCHRQLIADAFLVRGWRVQHIREDGCHEHKLPAFAQTVGTKIIYAEPPDDDRNGRLF